MSKLKLSHYRTLINSMGADFRVGLTSKLPTYATTELLRKFEIFRRLGNYKVLVYELGVWKKHNV